MKTEDFNYDLPDSFIAQTPLKTRHESKLMVLDRTRDVISHHTFWELDQFLTPNDLLVINQTRVIPARIFARKLPGAGRVEVLLLRKLTDLDWVCMVGGSGMKVGRDIEIELGPKAQIISVLDGPQRVIRFEQAIEPFFQQVGNVPLPPYIHEKLSDPERYQTIFANLPGSAAAPTAGLHFTPELMAKLTRKGIQIAELTLHVGLDTFAPVHEDNPAEHIIHKEWCQVSEDVVEKVETTRKNGGRVVAVGTTSVRTLESAAEEQKPGYIKPFSGDTGLFILPGYEFQVVDAMVTNFHLPKSTLLMLVSAFAGRQRMLDAYEIAKREVLSFLFIWRCDVNYLRRII